MKVYVQLDFLVYRTSGIIKLRTRYMFGQRYLVYQGDGLPQNVKDKAHFNSEKSAGTSAHEVVNVIKRTTSFPSSDLHFRG